VVVVGGAVVVGGTVVGGTVVGVVDVVGVVVVVGGAGAVGAGVVAAASSLLLQPTKALAASAPRPLMSCRRVDMGIPSGGGAARCRQWCGTRSLADLLRSLVARAMLR